MNWHKRTLQTYDESAEALAAYFQGIGPRVNDIERALHLADASTGAQVVEIGCGDGRDAAAIVPRVARYEGFDPSVGLLRIARQRLPQTSFTVSDAATYEYPAGSDVVFAFASLLHVDCTQLRRVLQNVAQSLRPGGVLYVSLKYRPRYEQEVKRDAFGDRMFYYYAPADIIAIAPTGMRPCHEAYQTIGKTEWFTLALQKTNST